jgi:hypothetical protein
MQNLLNRLNSYKGNLSIKDNWPIDPTRLSTHLRYAKTPLAAIGIEVEMDVDRRRFGGSQWDVVIAWERFAE